MAHIFLVGLLRGRRRLHVKLTLEHDHAVLVEALNSGPVAELRVQPHQLDIGSLVERIGLQQALCRAQRSGIITLAFAQGHEVRQCRGELLAQLLALAQ